MTHLQYQVIWVAELAAWIAACGFALWHTDRPARLLGDHQVLVVMQTWNEGGSR